LVESAPNSFDVFITVVLTQKREGSLFECDAVNCRLTTHPTADKEVECGFGTDKRTLYDIFKFNNNLGLPVKSTESTGPVLLTQESLFVRV
jgi:hypothetical protein